MKLTITQEQIDAALNKQSESGTPFYHADTDCPVAIALKAIGYSKARVGAYSIQTKPHAKRIVHTKALARWIDRFDNKHIATPRTFSVKGLIAA